MNYVQLLTQSILNTVQQTFNVDEQHLKSIEVGVNVEKRKQFGDMSCNAALVCAKVVGQNPRQLAAQLQEKLMNTPDTFHAPFLEKVEIAGPGFCNLFLNASFWAQVTGQIMADPSDFFANISEEKKHSFVIEFVSANPTGPLHLGHGRGGIIGDVLCNVLRLRGHKADKEYYINDAGSQMKKLGLSLKARCVEVNGGTASIPEGGYEGDYLIPIAQKFCKEHKNIEGTDTQVFTDYAQTHLLEKIKKTLKDYGITFDTWYSETTLHQGAIDKVIQLLQDKGLTFEKDGALWFKATDFNDDKDRVIRKADGTFPYIAADIAYHKNKFDRGYDKLIYIFGQDHHGYVSRLIGTVEALEYPAQDVDVILYQLVKIKLGGQAVKMSKRAGTFTELRDVIDTVGKDVARFFYLNRKAEAHLDFDLETALKKTDENPVFYIHYAFVRTHSLLRKAEQQPQLASFVQALRDNNLELISPYFDTFTHAEQRVVKKITGLVSIIQTIERSYQTHVLSFYTLELAQVFHSYYTNNQIINPKDFELSKTRLCLIVLVQKTLNICLDLLGLSKPEKM